MSYIPTVWKRGDIVSSEKLNKLEQGVADATSESIIVEETDAWLEENIAQETGYVLDGSLTMSNAAAPADKVGELKTALTQFEEELSESTTKTGTIVRFDNATNLVSDNYTGNVTVYGKNIANPYSYGSSPYVDNYEFTLNGISVKILSCGKFAMKRATAGSGNARLGFFSSSYNTSFVLPAGKYTASLFNLGRYTNDTQITPTGQIKLYSSGDNKAFFDLSTQATKCSYTFESDGVTPITLYLQLANSTLLDNIIGFQIELGETASVEYADGVKSQVTVSAGGSIGVTTDVITLVSGTLFSTNGTMTITGSSVEFLGKIDELDERVDNVEYTLNDLTAKKYSIPWVICSHTGRTPDSNARNTLQAFNNAWLEGATEIEMDARLTSDGKYVCYHNNTVTIGGTTYTISEMTQEAVSELVVYSDSKYGEWKIPTLEDALKFCCYTGMTVNLDCKNVEAVSLATTVVDNGMSGKVTYANIDDGYADDILAIDPLASFSFSYTESNMNKWKAALTDMLNRNRTVAWVSSPTKAIVEDIKANGFMFGSGINDMGMYPDIVLYEYNVNITTTNQAWLDTINFFGS